MQGEQNNIVKQQLIRQIKEFQSKDSMIQYYMSYDFPEKQRAVKGWWEDLIENVIRKKNQVYVTFKDLQTITSVNGMKPVPLKNVLKELKKQSIFIKQEDVTQEKRPEKKVKSWYTNIISFAWSKNDKDDVDFPFNFDPQQKIISFKIKQRKKRQLVYYLEKQLVHESSKFLRQFQKQISWALKIDLPSVDLLLKQLRRQRQVYVGEAQNCGDYVLIFNPERRKMLDDNFIKVEKIKCMLRWSLQKFEVMYDKSSVKILNLKQRAKDSLTNNDKTKARVLVAQANKEEQHREKINVRRQVLQQRITQIQVNQMNKSSIDLLQEAQNVYEEVAVDSEKFEEIMDKAREIQMESDQANRKFQELAASQDVDDQVNKMMQEIEEEAEQTKKKTIAQRDVRVSIPESVQKNAEEANFDNPYQRIYN